MCLERYRNIPTSTPRSEGVIHFVHLLWWFSHEQTPLTAWCIIVVSLQSETLAEKQTKNETYLVQHSV